MRSGPEGGDDVRLPEDYYVQAFLTVLDVVRITSSPILSDAERDWAGAIGALSEGARRLYVRLMMRRGTVFRMARLAYPEIADLPAARTELVRRGLACGAPPGDLSMLLSLHTVPEIDRLLEPVPGAGRRRVERVAALLERDAVEDRDRLAAASSWITPSGHAAFAVHRLCFFGNLRQDLSEFVLRDLGAVRYERYPLERAQAHFRTRHQLECHLRYHECESLLRTGRRPDATALAAVCARLPPHVPGDAHLERRLDRLRCELARGFERLGDAPRALALYAGSVRAPARERRVRLLDAAGQGERAAWLSRRMRAAPQGDAEAEFAARRLRGGARVRPFRPRTTSLTLRPDGRRVERVSRDYYARRGECFWTENRLVSGVCGLWAWDIVFAPVNGAFFNPFQSGPADFRERGFRARRAQAFDRRFDELLGEQGGTRLAERVLDGYAERVGTANPLVSWERLTQPLLRRATERIPVAHWAAMFERLLADPGEHTCGLPDLVHFPDAGGYEFIEIKGPGDALQAHQRRWLKHFDAYAIPARVVNVRWARSGVSSGVPPGASPGASPDASNVATP